MFDGACREFLKKKDGNGNPVEADTEDDVFDHDPPQKTNQIFKAVVEIIDLLEGTSGCFDGQGVTFADLYVKSGYYLVLAAKRFYNSGYQGRYIPTTMAPAQPSNQIFPVSPVGDVLITGYPAEVRVNQRYNG